MQVTSAGISATDKAFEKNIKEEEASETSAELEHDKIVQVRDDYEESRQDDSQTYGTAYEHLRDTELNGADGATTTEEERKAGWGGGH